MCGYKFYLENNTSVFQTQNILQMQENWSPNEKDLNDGPSWKALMMARICINNTYSVYNSSFKQI